MAGRVGDVPQGPFPGESGTLFEVAVIHHTQCGTGFLADPGFRRQAAEATGLPEAALEASAVTDPYITIRADVERLLTSPSLPPTVSVSGHVYDIATGHLTTTMTPGTPRLGLPTRGRNTERGPATSGMRTFRTQDAGTIRPDAGQLRLCRPADRTVSSRPAGLTLSLREA
jgi:hypothetical protein